MKLITVQDLDRWGCCGRGPGEKYSDEYLNRVLPKTPLQIANMRSIPVEDRVWVLLREEVLGDDVPEVMAEIVDPVVRKYALHCGVTEVEAWAAKWLSGEDRTKAAAAERKRQLRIIKRYLEKKKESE